MAIRPFSCGRYPQVGAVDKSRRANSSTELISTCACLRASIIRASLNNWRSARLVRWRSAALMVGCRNLVTLSWHRCLDFFRTWWIFYGRIRLSDIARRDKCAGKGARFARVKVRRAAAGKRTGAEGAQALPALRAERGGGNELGHESGRGLGSRAQRPCGSKPEAQRWERTRATKARDRTRPKL